MVPSLASTASFVIEADVSVYMHTCTCACLESTRREMAERRIHVINPQDWLARILYALHVIFPFFVYMYSNLDF